MTSYIVGVRHKTRSKVLTIEAEDALVAALRAKHENPEAIILTAASPIVVATIVIHMRDWRRQKNNSYRKIASQRSLRNPIRCFD